MLLAAKRLNLRTSNWHKCYQDSGTVRTRLPKISPKGDVARVTWHPKFLGVKC